MNHLASHIEVLLLENDCVVIPGFGGFIAHNVSATWNKDENLFSPPTRIIGFNPQLTLNDGLLIQSYMKSYKIDYTEANKILQGESREVINLLNNDGKVELPFIGEITCSADGIYNFSPYDERLNSPLYYGLTSFDMLDVKTLLNRNHAKEIIITPSRKTFIKPIWRNIAAVAAAILILFLLSPPIENTYVEEQSYANIFPGELFDNIRNKSIITTQVVATAQQKKTKPQEVKTAQVQPVAAREIKVSKTDSTQKVVQVAEHKYYLIVASVSTEEDAKRMVENLHAKTYSNAEVVLGNGKIRVSIASFESKDEAARQVLELRRIEAYKDAWVLKK